MQARHDEDSDIEWRKRVTLRRVAPGEELWCKLPPKKKGRGGGGQFIDLGRISKHKESGEWKKKESC